MPETRKRLKGAQVERLSAILRRAFNLQRFDELLFNRLDINREDWALGDSYEAIVFNFLKRVSAEYWVEDLIRAARESAPRDPDLLAFAQEFVITSTAVVWEKDASAQRHPLPAQLSSDDVLERQINKANSTFDIVKWRTQLGRIETQVCRVEISAPGTSIIGTGFLVGPDVVMTNYHVVESVIGGQVDPEKVACRFDYKLLADGNTLNPGTVSDLAKGSWLIDHSEYSPADLETNSQMNPQPEQLDYALLRLERSVGDEPVGDKPEPGAQPRGWIEVPCRPYVFVEDTALYIMQHPQGQPLKLALDTQAVISVNSNNTRVRYRTNTEPGSSGAPCFSKDWELVALHHSGDPNYAKLHKPEYNEGVPVAAIRSLLASRGKDTSLGA